VRIPKTITIDSHRSCNAQCRMCPTQDGSSELGWMDDNVFDALSEQIEPLAKNIQFVQFGVHGEPLLDTKLESRVARISSMGIRVLIATNAAAMTPKRAQRLLDAKTDQIFFAVDGTSRETYEKVRIGLSFQKVVGNITEFIRLRNAGGFKTRAVIRFIEQRANKHELPEWERKWKELVTEGLDSLQVVKMHNWAHKLEEIDSYGAVPCGDLVDNVIVSADGSIPLCCLDFNSTMPFGNILKQPLLDILNGEERRKMVSLHESGRRGEIEKCKNCYLPERSQNTPETEAFSEAVVNEDLHWN